MGLLADILPLAAFFIGYKFGDIFIATAAIMAAMPVQILLLQLAGRRLEPVHKATFLMVVLFGVLTLAFREGAFIQWKSTVINLGFGAALLISLKVFGRNLVSMMLSKAVHLPADAWATASNLLACFFFFMAALNTVLIYSVSEEVWVTIKTFGYPVLSVLAAGSVMAVSLRRAKAGGAPLATPEESASARPPGQAQ